MTRKRIACRINTTCVAGLRVLGTIVRQAGASSAGHDVCGRGAVVADAAGVAFFGKVLVLGMYTLQYMHLHILWPPFFHVQIVENYEYELPSDFEDEEIDEDTAFTGAGQGCILGGNLFPFHEAMCGYALVKRA